MSIVHFDKLKNVNHFSPNPHSHRIHIPSGILAVNKVDGALVEATTFLVCSEKRVPDRLPSTLLTAGKVQSKT